MDCLLNEVVNWSCDNLMNINWYKTKEMVLGAKLAFISDLCVNDNVVERVHVFKLLGVLLDVNLKWDSHVDAVCAKASIRLHFLEILKRCSLNSDDLLYFYTSVIRPILEYACPAWHNSLANEQSRQIVSVQKRALSIIFGYTWGHYQRSL